MGVFRLLSFIVGWGVQAIGDVLDWLAVDQIVSHMTALVEAPHLPSALAKPRRGAVSAP